MISNPHCGWCDFKIENFEGTPSYIGDGPLDLINAFIDYHIKGSGVVWFDEEGSEFTLVINSYSVFIIAERDEEPKLYDFSLLKFDDLEKELISDIEYDLDGWAEFITDETKTTNHKEELIQALNKLKKFIK